MIDDKRNILIPHSLSLDSRKSIKVTGVQDIESFDEETVVLFTTEGEMMIKGRELHINKIDLESGNLSLDGEILSISYNENPPMKSGILSRIFR